MVLVVKNPPANVRDIRNMDSFPELGRSSEGEPGNLLQYSCLENPMDWWATVHSVTKSQTRLKQPSTQARLPPFHMPETRADGTSST